MVRQVIHYASQCRTPQPQNRNPKQQVNTIAPYNNPQTQYNQQQQPHTPTPYENQYNTTTYHNNQQQQQQNTTQQNNQQQQINTIKANQETKQQPQENIAEYITNMRTEGNIIHIQHNNKNNKTPS